MKYFRQRKIGFAVFVVICKLAEAASKSSCFFARKRISLSRFFVFMTMTIKMAFLSPPTYMHASTEIRA